MPPEPLTWDALRIRELEGQVQELQSTLDLMTAQTEGVIKSTAKRIGVYQFLALVGWALAIAAAAFIVLECL